MVGIPESCKSTLKRNTEERCRQGNEYEKNVIEIGMLGMHNTNIIGDNIKNDNV